MIAPELESDIQDTVDRSRGWIVDFNAEKTNLLHLTSPITVPVEEKSSFNMLGLSFSSKLDWDSYITSIAKFVL